MSKTTKKKTTTKSPKKKSHTAESEMHLMLGMMQDMMAQKKVESAQSRHDPHPPAHGINSIAEIREDLNMLSSSLSGRMTQLEVKVTAMSESIDDIRTLMKERNAKVDQEIERCVKHTNDSVEEERTKRLKLLKALQKKLSDDDTTIMDRMGKMKEEVTKVTAGLSSDINGNFTELTRLKGALDNLTHQRDKYHTDAIDKLNSKVKSLDARVAAVASGHYMDDMGHAEEDLLFPDDASEEFLSNVDPPSVSLQGRYRSQSGSSTTGAFGRPRVSVQRVLQEVRQQLARQENSLEIAHQIANDAYSASTGKTHKASSSPVRRGSFKASKFNTTRRRDASESEDSDLPSKISLKSQQTELKNLSKRTKLLGENTSKACRTLSSGLTDVQQATLFLYAWCDKAHDAFGVVSSQLGLTTNLCPRVQVYRSNNVHKAIEDI